MKHLVQHVFATVALVAATATALADSPVYQSQSIYPVTSTEKQQVIGSDTDGSDLFQAFQGFLDTSSSWKSQEALTTAMFDLVTDFSVDFQVFDGIDLEFRPQRQVYFLNQPLRVDGTLADESTTHYVVMNNLISRLKGEFNLVDHVELTGETGFSFRVLRNQESITHLPLTEEIDLASESESAFSLSPQQAKDIDAKKHFSFLKFLGKAAASIYNRLEKVVQATAKPFIDDESSQILFANIFDPGREPFELPLNADYVDTKLSEGEIASFTAFTGAGPVVRVGEVASASLSTQVRLAYQVSVKKESNGFAILRLQLALRKGIEFEPIRVRVGLGLGPISVGYNLTRWQIESGNHHILERTYRYDLKVAEARKAFDQAIHGKFATTDRSLNVATWAEPIYSGSIDRSVYRNRFKANIGFLRANKEISRNVDTEVTSSGGTRYSGQSSLDSYFYIKLFKFFRHETAEHNNLQVGSLEESKSGWSVQNQIFLGNELTSSSDYKKMLALIQYALGPDAPPIPPRLSERVIEKKSQQRIEAKILLAPAAITAAFKTTPQQFWELLGKVFINDSAAWATPELRRLFELGIRDHSAIRANPVVDDSGLVNLKRYFLTAKNLGSSYEKIFKTESPVKKLEVLTKLHSQLGVSGLFNHLILTMSKARGGPSIPLYTIRFWGKGLKAPLTVFNNSGRTLIAVSSTQPIGDLENLTNSDRRIIDPIVFLDKGNPTQVHLRFDSLMKANQGQRLAVWISERKRLKDRPVATSVASTLTPEAMDPQSDGANYYAYEVALNSEMPLMRDTEYVMHYRLENAKGEPLSEFEKIWFKLP